MSAPTQRSTKVVIAPVVHAGASRATRTAARAYLVPRGRDLQPGDIGCQHTHGHRTVNAAKLCGTAMWRRLPAEVPS